MERLLMYIAKYIRIESDYWCYPLFWLLFMMFQVGLKQTIKIVQYSFEIISFAAKKQILYSKYITLV